MWQTTGGSTRKQKKRHKTRENIRAWIERDREDDDDDDERYEERAQTSVCLLSTTARPPLMQNRLSSSILHPGRKTIRRKNKQAPGTKIGSGQELAARLRLNGGKQAEMRERERERERRDRDSVYRPGADSVVAIETARLGRAGGTRRAMASGCYWCRR